MVVLQLNQRNKEKVHYIINNSKHCFTFETLQNEQETRIEFIALDSATSCHLAIC